MSSKGDKIYNNLSAFLEGIPFFENYLHDFIMANIKLEDFRDPLNASIAVKNIFSKLMYILQGQEHQTCQFAGLASLAMKFNWCVLVYKSAAFPGLIINDFFPLKGVDNFQKIKARHNLLFDRLYLKEDQEFAYSMFGLLLQPPEAYIAENDASWYPKFSVFNQDANRTGMIRIPYLTKRLEAIEIDELLKRFDNSIRDFINQFKVYFRNEAQKHFNFGAGTQDSGAIGDMIDRKITAIGDELINSFTIKDLYEAIDENKDGTGCRNNIIDAAISLFPQLIIKENEVLQIYKRLETYYREYVGREVEHVCATLKELFSSIARDTLKDKQGQEDILRFKAQLARALNKPELLDLNDDKLVKTWLIFLALNGGWRYYYYIPAKFLPNQAVGALAIGCQEPFGTAITFQQIGGYAKNVNSIIEDICENQIRGAFSRITDTLFSEIAALDMHQKRTEDKAKYINVLADFNHLMLKYVNASMWSAAKSSDPQIAEGCPQSQSMFLLDYIGQRGQFLEYLGKGDNPIFQDINIKLELTKIAGSGLFISYPAFQELFDHGITWEDKLIYWKSLFETKFPIDKEVFAFGHLGAFYAIFENLIFNSLYHGRKRLRIDGKIVEYDTSFRIRLIIEPIENSPNYRITFADNGIGFFFDSQTITREEGQQQVENWMRRGGKVKGPGFGLWIIDQAMRYIKGSSAAISLGKRRIHKGVSFGFDYCFELTFPVRAK